MVLWTHENDGELYLIDDDKSNRRSKRIKYESEDHLRRKFDRSIYEKKFQFEFILKKKIFTNLPGIKNDLFEQ